MKEKEHQREFNGYPKFTQKEIEIFIEATRWHGPEEEPIDDDIRDEIDRNFSPFSSLADPD